MTPSKLKVRIITELALDSDGDGQPDVTQSLVFVGLPWHPEPYEMTGPLVNLPAHAAIEAASGLAKMGTATAIGVLTSGGMPNPAAAVEVAGKLAAGLLAHLPK